MGDEIDSTIDVTADEDLDSGIEFDEDEVPRAVAFMLAGQRYALPIVRVQEIQQIVALSEVPGGGSGVIGMINLRGSVIPAIDLRRLVGLPTAEYTLETPMIICHVGDRLVALVVDEVLDVIELSDEIMQETPQMHSLASKMLGVARLPDGLLYLLDVDALLAPVMGGGW